MAAAWLSSINQQIYSWKEHLSFFCTLCFSAVNVFASKEEWQNVKPSSGLTHSSENLIDICAQWNDYCYYIYIWLQKKIYLFANNSFERTRYLFNYDCSSSETSVCVKVLNYSGVSSAPAGLRHNTYLQEPAIPFFWEAFCYQRINPYHIACFF